MQTLGSMFIAHPPIAPYTVTVADREHPLVAGVEPFETTDEIYLLETYGPLHVMLETEFGGRRRFRRRRRRRAGLLHHTASRVPCCT
jgi:type 1 glutamine amidotransferase